MVEGDGLENRYILSRVSRVQIPLSLPFFVSLILLKKLSLMLFGKIIFCWEVGENITKNII